MGRGTWFRWLKRLRIGSEGKAGMRSAIAAVIVLATCLCVASARGDSVSDWPSYLLNVGHSSSGGSGAITPENASTLRKLWAWKAAGATQSGQPGGALNASPTVYGGRVFLGANTGEFYALDLASGAVIWHRNLGWRPKLTCNARGITSTAAVAPDDLGRPTVYVGGGDGYLYALDAATGTQRWRTVVGGLPSATASDYYNWASPIVVNGVVYDGISSMCDKPFVPGGLQAFDQATGATTHTYLAVSGTALGGGVWTSPAADDQGNIFVTTGSGSGSPPGDMYSVVRLNAPRLPKRTRGRCPRRHASVTATGSSPTLFSATLGGVTTTMVAACNKNGILYALGRTISAPGQSGRYGSEPVNANGTLACLPAPVWQRNASADGWAKDHDRRHRVQRFDALARPGHRQRAVGAGPLGGLILGTPSVSAGGVIAAATYDSTTGVTNGTYLLDARDGGQLNFLSFANSKQFAQPVFVGNDLLMASQLAASTSTSSPPPPTPPRQPRQPPSQPQRPVRPASTSPGQPPQTTSV